MSVPRCGAAGLGWSPALPLLVWGSAHCSAELKGQARVRWFYQMRGLDWSPAAPSLKHFLHGIFQLRELFLHSQSIAKWSDLKSQLLQREAEFMKNQGSSSYHGNCFKTEKPDFAILAVSGGFSVWKDDRVNLPHGSRCALCSGLLKTTVFA